MKKNIAVPAQACADNFTQYSSTRSQKNNRLNLNGEFIFTLLLNICLLICFTILLYGIDPTSRPGEKKEIATYGQISNELSYTIHEANDSEIFYAENQHHQLEFRFQPDGFIVNSADNNLNIKMDRISLSGSKENSRIDHTAESKITCNNILTYHNQDFDIQYINDARGMRQNFIVHHNPVNNAELKITMQVCAENLSLSCTNNNLLAGDGTQVKYTYSDLKVWDVNHKMLSAKMELTGNELALIVDDANAVYPVIIDPISTNPDAILEGNQSLSYFGNAVANAGDVNGDGYDDVISGGYNYDNGTTNEGGVFVYHGSATGISTTPAAILESNIGSIRYGVSIAGAGDVNNDGYDDIIVGASHYAGGQAFEGRVYIYHGSAAGINTTPALMIESNGANFYFGVSVAGAGDINNDGYDDIAVGATGYANGQIGEGAVYVYKGSATGISTASVVILEPNQIGATMGSGVSSAGDVNNDGYDDIVAGAMYYDNVESNEGAIYIYHGSSAGITATPARIAESNTAGAALGISVSTAGDVNNDGYADVVAGASLYSNGQANEGKIFVYLGSATGIPADPATVVESNQTSAYFGGDVSNAGDLNNNGYDDIVVGAQSYDNLQTDEGGIFIYHGSATGIPALYTVSAESNQASANFGSGVGGGGDVNGDGFDDIIAGAYLYDGDIADEGFAFIYHGNNCTPSNFYPDADLDGYGGATGLIISCEAPAGYCSNNLDCNDAVALYNPATIWLMDYDDDGYYDETVSPIVQCPYPGTGYVVINYVNPGDCDDSVEYTFPGAAENLDGTDNNCNGNADEGLNFTFDAILAGHLNNEYFGFDMSSAGDLNSDGYDDIVIGSYSYTDAVSNSGAVFVYYGSATGINQIPAQIIEGTKSWARFGIAVAADGDINNDGYNDLVVGSDFYELGAITYENDGAVFVYFGTAGGLFNSTPDSWYYETIDNTNFGARLRYAGDINGDGFDDIVVTKVNYSHPESLEGAAVLIYGSASGLGASVHLECDQAFANMGWYVDGAGDVNGDGYDDLLSAAINYDNGETNEGRVYIYHGSAGGIITTPAIMLESNQASAFFGSVTGAGDINNDGYGDIAIGAYSYENGDMDEGVLFIYHGSSTGISAIPSSTIEVNVAGALLGRSISAAGDVNADGYADIVAGGTFFYNGQSQEGAAWIFKGSAAGLVSSPVCVIEGNQVNAHFGAACSDAGDLNGDGADDILIGAPDFDYGFLNSGAAFIYLGICDFYFYADADGDGFGDNAVNVHACSAPPGYIADNTDCNDTNNAIYPGATEICNTIDDDCDATVDEGAAPTISIAAGGTTTFCQGGNVLLSAIYSGTSVQWKKNGTNITGAISSNYSVNKSGNYSAITTSPCGSTESSSINVIVNKNPKASISAGGATSFCTGGSVTLTEMPSGGCTYQWYKGASLIAGATSTNYIATTAGNYRSRVTKTATGCYKNSNAISVTVPCREGEWSVVSGELGFMIYPNPNNGTFEISVQNLAPASPFFEGGQRPARKNRSDGGMSIDVFNSLGQLIYTQQINSPDNNFTETITLDNISSGIYFVRVGDGNNYSEQKLIIEK